MHFFPLFSVILHYWSCTGNAVYQYEITTLFFQLFGAAADVLRRIGEDARIIQEFVDLGAKTRVAASEALDAEAVLGDIPDEFLDPIQVNNLILFDWIHYTTMCSIIL